jgi:hypothetical protein
MVSQGMLSRITNVVFEAWPNSLKDGMLIKPKTLFGHRWSHEWCCALGKGFKASAEMDKGIFVVLT